MAAPFLVLAIIFQLAEGGTGEGQEPSSLLYRAQPRNCTHHFHSNSLVRTRQTVLLILKGIKNIILPTMFLDSKGESKYLVYGLNDKHKSSLAGEGLVGQI